MIRQDPARVQQIRSRLSDISWWMRLLSQKIGRKANQEDQELGKFWQARIVRFGFWMKRPCWLVRLMLT